MPGAYFTQGAVQNAVRPGPRDEDLRFANGANIDRLDPRNIANIAKYINTVREKEGFDPRHAEFIRQQILAGQKGWHGDFGNTLPQYLYGAKIVADGAEGAAGLVYGSAKAVTGLGIDKAVKGAAYKHGGKAGLKAAQRGLTFAAEGAALPVAIGAELVAAGAGEAYNVTSRPSVEQVQSHVPEALFHASRDPHDLTRFKDWSHVGGKILHALNPFEGLYRKQEMIKAIKANPNAHVDYDTLDDYMLGGVPKGFSPIDPTAKNSLRATEENPGLTPLRAERAAFIKGAQTQSGASFPGMRDYAIYNAIQNQRFLAAAEEEEKRQEEMRLKMLLQRSLHPRGIF